MRRTLMIVAATAAAVMTGCVYRPPIQQGNLLQYEDVEQVKVGMTRSQVRYLLGTPMVSDPFEPDRWDYVYTLQVSRTSRVDRAHVVVFFEGDKVSKVERKNAPPPPPAPAAATTPAAAATPAATPAAAAPAAPATAPPAADQTPATTPPPGGG